MLKLLCLQLSVSILLLSKMLFATAPIGWLDSATMSQISGWACDPDVPGESIVVHIYFGGPAGCTSGCIAVEVPADIPNEKAVSLACGGGSAHRFSYSVSDSIINFLGSGSYKVYVYGIDTTGSPNPLLNGAPKIIDIPLSTFISPFVGQWIMPNSVYMLNIAADGSFRFWQTINGTKYTGTITSATLNSITMTTTNSTCNFEETCNVSGNFMNCKWHWIDCGNDGGTETFQSFNSVPFLTSGQSFSIDIANMAGNYHGRITPRGYDAHAADLILNVDAEILKGSYIGGGTLNVVVKATNSTSFILFEANSDGSYLSKDECTLSPSNNSKFICTWFDTSSTRGDEIFAKIVTSQVSDVEGRNYNTVKIGEQWWMAENLKVTKFNNGDSIINANIRESWKNATDNKIPAWVNYGWNSANDALYGKIYNWFAVDDTRGLCPAGWHVPNERDYRILASSVDSQYTNPNGAEWIPSAEFYTKQGTDAGANLRSRTLWNGSTPGIDLYGFNLLPGGYKRLVPDGYTYDDPSQWPNFGGQSWDFYGGEVDIGYGQTMASVRMYGLFWSSTVGSFCENAICLYNGNLFAAPGYDSQTIHMNIYVTGKTQAAYVRCVKTDYPALEGQWSASDSSKILNIKASAEFYEMNLQSGKEYNGTFSGNTLSVTFKANEVTYLTQTFSDRTGSTQTVIVDGTNIIDYNTQTFAYTNICTISNSNTSMNCARTYSGGASETITYSKISSSEVISADGGAWHSLSLKSDGKVFAFGRNTYGELGDGTNIDRSSPVAVLVAPGVPLKNIIKISAGGYHSLALKNDGTVWSFGLNDSGQLGNGTTINKYYATQVMESQGVPLTNVKDISAGINHSMVLKNNGILLTFGANIYGQLGDGTTLNKSYPILISALTNIKNISAGSSYSMVLTNEGTVFSFGINNVGQLGDGTNTNRFLPVEVMKTSGVELSKVIMISAGATHSMALTNDGKVFTFGLNNTGQLGDGTNVSKSFATEVTTLSDIKEIANGSLYSLVLKNDGTVFAFGNNSFGQLGNGTTSSSYYPIQVMQGAGVPLIHVKHISCGAAFSLVTEKYGTLFTFGQNYTFGQLGDGTKINRPYPVFINGF